MSNEHESNAGEFERPPLRRCPQGRIVAGVAAGLADHLQVDVNLIRVAIILLTVLGGIGAPLYLAAWVLIPEAGAERSMAEDFFAGLHTP